MLLNGAITIDETEIQLTDELRIIKRFGRLNVGEWSQMHVRDATGKLMILRMRNVKMNLIRSTVSMSGLQTHGCRFQFIRNASRLSGPVLY